MELDQKSWYVLNLNPPIPSPSILPSSFFPSFLSSFLPSFENTQTKRVLTLPQQRQQHITLKCPWSSAKTIKFFSATTSRNSSRSPSDGSGVLVTGVGWVGKFALKQNAIISKHPPATTVSPPNQPIHPYLLPCIIFPSHPPYFYPPSLHHFPLLQTILLPSFHHPIKSGLTKIMTTITVNYISPMSNLMDAIGTLGRWNTTGWHLNPFFSNSTSFFSW